MTINELIKKYEEWISYSDEPLIIEEILRDLNQLKENTKSSLDKCVTSENEYIRMFNEIIGE